jgi:hypothetical protein
LPLLTGIGSHRQGGERSFVAQSVWVVADADQDGRRGVRPHSLAANQFGCHRAGDPAQADLRACELFIEQLDALGDFPHTSLVTAARLSSSTLTRNAAQVSTSSAVLSARSRIRSSSGAVATMLRSWLAA